MKRIRKKSRPSQMYQPVMDWWIAVATFFLLGLLLAMLPSIIWSSLPGWQIAVVTLCIAMIILYIIDSAFFTSYYLQDKGLLVISQIRQYQLPYRSMTAIRSSGFRGLISLGRRKRFSFSTSGYDILLEGSAWRVISVSPKERDRFIESLLTRIDDDRSKRVTIDA